MKKILFLFALFFASVECVAAPASRPVAGRVAPQRQTATATAGQTSAPQSNAGQQQNVAQQPTTQSAVRAARTPVKSNTPSTVSVGRSATKTTTAPKVTARAAKQNVIMGGTKVAGAGQNKLVDEECQAKFDGCMDSFCMMENANGGRCLCSNRNKELDTVLAEIEKLDKQSYQMATTGVEKIEMGEDGDAISAAADAAAKAVLGETEQKNKRRRSLDLTSLNNTDDEGDMFDLFGAAADENSVEGKEGDALYNVSYKLCTEQIPECSSSMKMLDSLYKQRIRSDCMAYENSLKKQRDASAQKLQAAQTALREAALEQYNNQNKYDLGQCMLQFKQCMKTTGECGEDFSGCATIAGVTEAQNATHSRKKLSKPYKIKGATTTIEIAATTYDTLLAKKPLCMGVTKNCVSVRDQVWDAFLTEAAPEIKSAESIAEGNLRDSCLENIGNCFKKACKDNMDPNDPDGSYDMCLARPRVFESLCKVQIQPCVAAEPNIMESVLATLASIRTDACTREFKECLTSEDRCGSDYSQCIGLDTATITDMCPREKLTGCYYEYNNDKKTVDEMLATIADGIFLGIDEGLIGACQKALDASMIKVCGSTDTCENLMTDTSLGTRSMKYQVCEYWCVNSSGFENWSGKCYDSWDSMSVEEFKKYTGDAPKAADGTDQNYNKLLGQKNSGKIYWDSILLKDDEQNVAEMFPNVDQYIANVRANNPNEARTMNEQAVRDAYNMEINSLINATASVIKAVEADKKVQDCVSGRQFQGGIRDKNGNVKMLGSNSNGRLPHLTSQMRILVATTVLKFAQNNYAKKIDDETSRLRKAHLAMIKKANESVSADKAEKICKDIENEDYPGHLPPEKKKGGDNEDKNWNFVYKVSASFNRATGDCTVIRTTQNCKKTKKNYCKEWEDPKEETTVINLTR